MDLPSKLPEWTYAMAPNCYAHIDLQEHHVTFRIDVGTPDEQEMTIVCDSAHEVINALVWQTIYLTQQYNKTRPVKS